MPSEHWQQQHEDVLATVQPFDHPQIASIRRVLAKVKHRLMLELGGRRAFLAFTVDWASDEDWRE
jgi:hypothetical protein